MTWAIRYTREAERAIDALDPPVRRRVMLAIDNLLGNPRSASNVTKLQGRDDDRLRVGDWRIVYKLHEGVLLVLVVAVGHGREVYR